MDYDAGRPRVIPGVAESEYEKVMVETTSQRLFSTPFSLYLPIVAWKAE